MTEPLASTQTLARLRRKVDEPDDDGGAGWTDLMLDDVLTETANADGTPNLNRAASHVWYAKAATLAALTDTTESGSSRRNSQAWEHAMKMGALYEGLEAGAVVAAVRPQSERIVRPTRA